ncbi:hypothetical protein ZHAS_00006331 [Anopheles sinensis]|uniref:Uncharacterized protein n=1 Tax=Anopheles sinensis TaxID=74873 RepID=A0A084VLJ9_ANOSI|nr:hypothetical protein ZHAS_00006331 [Anopheles sinensis]
MGVCFASEGPCAVTSSTPAGWKSTTAIPTERGVTSSWFLGSVRFFGSAPVSRLHRYASERRRCQPTFRTSARWKRNGKKRGRRTTSKRRRATRDKHAKTEWKIPVWGRRVRNQVHRNGCVVVRGDKRSSEKM